MKITTVTIEMKRSDNNWGNDTARFEAVLNEGEDPLLAAGYLRVLADWQLNGERRQQIANEQLDIQEHESSTDDQKEKAARYLQKYESWLSRVGQAKEAIQF